MRYGFVVELHFLSGFGGVTGACFHFQIYLFFGTTKANNS